MRGCARPHVRWAEPPFGQQPQSLQLARQSASGRCRSAAAAESRENALELDDSSDVARTSSVREFVCMWSWSIAAEY